MVLHLENEKYFWWKILRFSISIIFQFCVSSFASHRIDGVIIKSYSVSEYAL